MFLPSDEDIHTAVERRVTEIAEPFDMSLPGVSKHLKVLQKAGLVIQGRDAQWRPCQLAPEPLKDVADWVGASAATLCADVLVGWRFPEDLCFAIRHQDDDPAMARDPLLRWLFKAVGWTANLSVPASQPRASQT